MDGQIPAKFLQVGDKIKSIIVNQIDPETPDSYQFSTWTSSELTTGEIVETTITEITESQETDIIFFNGNSDIKMTFTQPIFVKMPDGTYKIKEAYYVDMGDKLIHVDSNGDMSETEVTSIDYVTDESMTVYQYSCEPYDWFFVSGLLVHNK